MRDKEAEILLIQKLIHISSTIKKCGEIMVAEHKKPKLPKGEPEPGGVFYIDRGIEREFEAIRGKPMPAIELADYYISWCDRTLEQLERNQEYLWIPKLASHCFDNYMIISSALQTFKLEK